MSTCDVSFKAVLNTYSYILFNGSTGPGDTNRYTPPPSTVDFVDTVDGVDTFPDPFNQTATARLAA
jgi:hypothetical protein